MKKILYIRTTTDKYEFPLYICDSVKELSKKTGRTSDSINSMITRGVKGWQRIEIEVEEGEKI